MADVQVTEGKVPFDVPSAGVPCETYYKIFGDLHSGLPPVVVVHGGPGAGHNYLLVFRKLWDRHKLPVVFYDTIGVGKSTHLRHKKDDGTFWTMDLLVRDLENLIDHLKLADSRGPGYYLLGHSVGGMMSAYLATRRPQGLKKMILANTPGSVDLHMHGMHLWAKDLPEESQEAFREAERTDNWQAQSYLDALALLNSKHHCRAIPFPDEIEQSAKNFANDWTITGAMWGPTPWKQVGSLKGWNCFSELPKINVPTLLYHGELDVERHEVVAPYVEHVPGIRKVTFAGLSHMTHVEDEEKVLDLVGSFFMEG